MLSNLFLMCLEFFKTGLFSIGGGLATLPFLFEMSDNHPDWFTHSDLADIIAVSESTPGPIGINIATFAGFKVYGILGSILATFSLVLPSFIIIITISKFLSKYSDNKYLKRALKGLTPAACGLIGAAAYSIFKIALFTKDIHSISQIPNLLNISALVIAVVTFVLLQTKFFKKIHPIIYIISGAAIGIILKL